MNTVSFTITAKAPKKALFAYLSDISNLPEWATDFCQRLDATADGHQVMTPMGPMAFRIVADAGTGVIDMLTRMEGQPEDILATRVLGQPNGGSAWVVTFTPPADLPEKMFGEQCASIEREMGNVQRLFDWAAEVQSA
jgi:hypothetical protein